MSKMQKAKNCIREIIHEGQMRKMQLSSFKNIGWKIQDSRPGEEDYKWKSMKMM